MVGDVVTNAALQITHEFYIDGVQKNFFFFLFLFDDVLGPKVFKSLEGFLCPC
jgi:hypothetical protein